jgi:hypothetical protein
MVLALAALPVHSEVIANSVSSIETLTKQEAFAVFAFDVKFASGKRLKVILPPEDSISFKALAKRIDKTPSNYLDIVKSKEHGGVTSLIWATSESNVITKVSTTPYSIGFYHDKIAINTGLGIRVIPIN